MNGFFTVFLTYHSSNKIIPIKAIDFIEFCCTRDVNTTKLTGYRLLLITPQKEKAQMLFKTNEITCSQARVLEALCDCDIYVGSTIFID